ncbi:MAG TPA: hypothetical protein PK263_03050 [bacterium]|nr:hypothetical protein [bacterium]
MGFVDGDIPFPLDGHSHVVTGVNPMYLAETSGDPLVVSVLRNRSQFLSDYHPILGDGNPKRRVPSSSWVDRNHPLSATIYTGDIKISKGDSNETRY